MNEGIPVRRIADATHREFHPVHIRDAGSALNARIERIERGGDRTLSVYRPALPTPTSHRTRMVGESVRTDSRIIREIRDNHSRDVRTLRENSITSVSSRPHHDVQAAGNRVAGRTEQPADRNTSALRSASRQYGTSPIVLRGTERISSGAETRNTPRGSIILRGAHDTARTQTATGGGVQSGSRLRNELRGTQPIVRNNQNLLHRSTTESQNRSSRILLDSGRLRQYSPATPQASRATPVQPQQFPRTVTRPDLRVQQIERQPSVNYRQQDQRILTQPTPRAERQVPQYRPPPVRDQSRFGGNRVERSFTPPPAPREQQSAPVRSAPSRSYSAPSRSDRSDNRRGR